MAYDADNPPEVELRYIGDGSAYLHFEESDFDDEAYNGPIGAYITYITPPANTTAKRYVSFGFEETREEDGDEYTCDDYGVCDDSISNYEWSLSEAEWMRFPPELRPFGTECLDSQWAERVAVRIQYVYDSWEVN